MVIFPGKFALKPVIARVVGCFAAFGRIGVMPDQPGDHSEQIRSSVILFSVAIRKENSVPLSIPIKNNQSTKSEILFVKKSSLGSFMGHGGGVNRLCLGSGSCTVYNKL